MDSNIPSSKLIGIVKDKILIQINQNMAIILGFRETLNQLMAERNIQKYSSRILFFGSDFSISFFSYGFTDRRKLDFTLQGQALRACQSVWICKISSLIIKHHISRSSR